MDIQNLADGVGKMANAIPEVYADGAKGTVQQSGKALERIPRFLNALAADFDIWMMKREAKVREVSILIDKKLQGVSEEKVVPPDPHIAVPALQAISYSMDSDMLRDIYANLLAKSMNVDTKDDVHPAFVEVIKQLSPRDASNLCCFPKTIGETLPVAKYIEKWDVTTGYDERAVNVFVSNPAYNDMEKQSASITLLKTLGIVEIYYDAYDPKPNAYKPFYETPLFLRLKEDNERRNATIQAAPDEVYKLLRPNDAKRRTAILSIQNGVVQLTPWGIEFYRVCLHI